MIFHPNLFITIIFKVDVMEITGKTLISEIVENCPEAMPAFQSIGMHCMGCAMASGESVEEACAAHGYDAEEFLVALKNYLATL